MTRRILLLAGLILAMPGTVAGQSAADSAAIVQTALDYIQGWYTGNAERMERALHPELAKRVVGRDRETGKAIVHNMTTDQLVQGTRAGYGTQTPEDQRRDEVTILDIYGNAASVKVVARDWIDYLHIGKFDDRWMIVNVLWEMTPEAKARMGGGD